MKKVIVAVAFGIFAAAIMTGFHGTDYGAEMTDLTEDVDRAEVMRRQETERMITRELKKIAGEEGGTIQIFGKK